MSHSAFLLAGCDFADRHEHLYIFSGVILQENVTPEQEAWRHKTMQEPRRTFIILHFLNCTWVWLSRAKTSEKPCLGGWARHQSHFILLNPQCWAPWLRAAMGDVHSLSHQLMKWSQSPCTNQFCCPRLGQKKGTPGNGQPPWSCKISGRYPWVEGSPRKPSSHGGHSVLEACNHAAFRVRIKTVLSLLQTALDSNAR